MGTDALKIEGFVEIELINKKDHVRRTYKNTITGAGKKYMLSQCAGNIMRLGAEDLGNMNGVGVLGKIWNSLNDGKQAHSETDITNVCLNLSAAELAALDGNSTCINLWDSTLENKTKLIGFANNQVATQSGNTKEGVLDKCKGEYVVDGACVAKRWHYPAGIGSGNINCIAMMPSDNVKNLYGLGLGAMKSLDPSNRQVDSGAPAYSMMPPGVAGYTGNTEIMLNTTAGSGQWKIDLSTGEITEIASGGTFAVLPGLSSGYGIADVLVKSNMVYYIVENYGWNGWENTLHYYNITTQAHGTVNIPYSVVAAKFIELNGTVYISRIENYRGSSRYYSATSLAFDASGIPSLSQTYAYNDYSWLTSNFPAGLDDFTGYGVAFGNWGSNYIAYRLVGDYYNNSSDARIAGYIFSDPTDIGGSIIGYVGAHSVASCPINVGNNPGLIETYKSNNMQQPNASYIYSDWSQDSETVYNRNASSSYGTRYYNNEVNKLMMDGWSSNVLSFVKLSTPISKSDEDEMYVSYGYRVV